MRAYARSLNFPESKFPFLENSGVKLGQRFPSHFTTNKTFYYLLHPKALNSYFERFFFLQNFFSWVIINIFPCLKKTKHATSIQNFWLKWSIAMLGWKNFSERNLMFSTAWIIYFSKLHNSLGFRKIYNFSY